MRSLTLRSASLVIAGCLVAGASWAQSTSRNNPSEPSRADAAFMKQAAENGHAEVESSRLALQKSPDERVKRFAQMMVDDHTRAGAELKALATRKGVEVSDQPSVMQRAKLKVLSAADGADFSRRYIESMGVEAHKETIELFEKASTQANDADVKAFASKTLPTLQKHLTMAHELHGSHQSTTGGQRSAPSGSR